jgi:flagellar hook assembly protein FlgD
LKERSEVTVQVYDLLGRVVAMLVNDVQEAGLHSIDWNASGLASGMYIFRMTTPEFTQLRKTVLLK